MPPSDRTEATDCDRELIAKLRGFIEANNLTQTAVAKKTGVDPSALNAWLNDKPKGNFRALEAAVADYLHNEPLRVKLSLQKFSTTVARKFRQIYLDTRETTTLHNISVVTGPAGVGKTSGMQLLQVEFTTSVLITPYKLSGGAVAQFNHLRCAVSDRGWPLWHRSHPAGSLLDFYIERFARSDRMFLIDMCHRLTMGGIEFWFDMAEQTQCPVIFTGNPRFLSTLAGMQDNDQQLSRVGRYYDLSPKAGRRWEGAREMAAGMLAQLLPDHAEALLPLAEQIAAKPGHGRRLLKSLDLTRRMLLGGCKDAALALQDTQTMLLDQEMLDLGK